MKKSIDAASNLTEQINKANVVFRGSQREVIEWSKNLADSFGLSQRAALEAAGTFGNMLVPMGFARKEAAGMSQRLVELAGDMASFNNASPAETLESIRAGLAGETEPLRKYGVFLSAARVQAEALNETHKKSAKQLTQTDKTLAAYNLILKDTKDTQGDFARSAGTSLANQLRITKAEFENLAASLGQALLPAVVEVLGFINNRLIPGLGDAAAFVSDFWESIQKKLSKAPNLRAKMRIVFEGVETLASQFVDALVSKVTALLPQKEVPVNFKLRHRGGETMTAGVDWNAVATAIVAALSAALAASTDLAKGLGDTVSRAMEQVDWAGVGAKAGSGIAQAMTTALGTILDPVFWVRNWDLALSIALVAFSGPLGKLVGSLGRLMGPAFVGMLARISPVFAAAMGRLLDDAGRVALLVFNRIRADLFRLATSLFGRLTKAAVFTIKVLGVQAAINAIAQFAGAIDEKLDQALRWFTRLSNRLDKWATGLASDMLGWGASIGSALVDGVKNGIAGGWDALLGWLSKQVSKIPKFIRNFFGISSPSTVMADEVGKPLAEGIVIGFVEGLKEFPNRSSTAMKNAVIAAREEFEKASRVLGRSGALKIVEGFRSEQPSLAQQIKTALHDAIVQAIQEAQQAVRDARANFASAFGTLASDALGAFDAAMSAWKAPAQKLLDKRALDKQKADLQAAINEAAADIGKANQAMAKALAGGDPAEIQAARDQQIAAQKAYNDALYNQETFAIEQRAAQQQAAHDKEAARNKIRLQNALDANQKQWQADLAALAKRHENGLLSEKAYHAAVEKENDEHQQRVSALLKKYGGKLGVDSAFWGTAAGISLADGLRKAMAPVRAAARELAKAIERLLKLKPKGSWDTEEGPMADFGHWWDPMAASLVGNIDFGLIRAAGVRIGAEMGLGLKETKVDTSGILASIGILKGTVAPAVESLTEVSDSYDTVSESIGTVTQKAAALWQPLIDGAKKAFADLNDPLTGIASLYLLVADAITAIGAAAYATRDALRDTASEIVQLWRQIAASGAPIPGKALGGPVYAGRPYVVGERGPELFIPSTSGRIVANGNTSMRAAGGGQTTIALNFYGPAVGTDRQFQDLVRRALYDVSRRNPGIGLAT